MKFKITTSTGNPRQYVERLGLDVVSEFGRQDVFFKEITCLEELAEFAYLTGILSHQLVISFENGENEIEVYNGYRE